MRALRLAAAALAEPFGALSIALAAAESLPSALSPALDLVSFSPFGTIPNFAGAAGAEPGAAAAAAAARRKAPGSGASPGAGRDAGTGQTAGARASSPAAAHQVGGPAPAAGGIFSSIAQALAAAAAAAPAESGAHRRPPPPPKPAQGVAPAGPTGTITGAFGLLGALVGEVEGAIVQTVGTVAGGGATARPAGAPPSQPTAPHSPASSRPAAGTGILETVASAAGTGILETVASAAGEAIQAAAGVAGPTGEAAGRAVAEAIRAGVEAVTPRQPSPLEGLSRALLATPFEGFGAGAVAAARQAAVSTASPAPAPGATGQPAPPAAAANGTVGQAAPPDAGELAWLVNEALIEQARRHGMDLS